MRRRGRSPTTYSGTNTAPETQYIDRDDQDELVASLEDEATYQTKQFQKYFGFIGAFALLASLLYPLLCQEECSSRWIPCWMHATSSSVAHGLAIHQSRNDIQSQFSKWQLLALLLVGTPFSLWLLGKFPDDIEHFHLGLIIGNVVTFVGTMILRWDTLSTKKAIEDLHGEKYAYKTL